MHIYWLQQSASDLPSDDAWLSAGERECLNDMHFPKRRADWRLGRWTAKRAIAAYLSGSSGPHALSNIEIRPAPTGAPDVFLDGKAAGISISLTHRKEVAVCAIGRVDVALGCDLEAIEPRCDAFVADYFTEPERKLIATAHFASHPLLVSLIWSAKESALKALHTGLRLATQSVEVSIPPIISEEIAAYSRPAVARARGGWNPLSVTHSPAEIFDGWWSRRGDLLLTVLSRPGALLPICLNG